MWAWQQRSRSPSQKGANGSLPLRCYTATLEMWDNSRKQQCSGSVTGETAFARCCRMPETGKWKKFSHHRKGNRRHQSVQMCNATCASRRVSGGGGGGARKWKWSVGQKWNQPRECVCTSSANVSIYCVGVCVCVCVSEWESGAKMQRRKTKWALSRNATPEWVWVPLCALHPSPHRSLVAAFLVIE